MKKGFEKFAKQAREMMPGVECEKILKHIEIVCDEEYDSMLQNEYKTFEKAWDYVKENARKHIINGCACIDDDVVYGWIDEYVGLDEKKDNVSQIQKTSKDTKENKEKDVKQSSSNRYVKEFHLPTDVDMNASIPEGPEDIENNGNEKQDNSSIKNGYEQMTLF